MLENCLKERIFGSFTSFAHLNVFHSLGKETSKEDIGYRDKYDYVIQPFVFSTIAIEWLPNLGSDILFEESAPLFYISAQTSVDNNVKHF